MLVTVLCSIGSFAPLLHPHLSLRSRKLGKREKKDMIGLPFVSGSSGLSGTSVLGMSDKR